VTATTSHPHAAEPGTFVALVATLLRHPRLLFGLPVGAAVLAGLLSISRGPQYAARAELAPRASDNRLANLAGLAAQFGVSAGSLGPTEGVEFYAEVLRSNEILGAVVTSSFQFSKRRLGETTGDSARGTLMDIWGIKGPTPEVREAAAVRRLRASMTARPNIAANLLRLEVTARWPELAVQINRHFLQALDAFNLHTRQSQAAAQRRFIEQRLADQKVALTADENALAEFESRNRLLQIPSLILERQRLQRRVDVSQQVYLTLAQSYEQARIDEVRDTPVVTVVDAPENTVEQSGGLVLFVLLGGFVGGLAGLGLSLLGEVWARQLADHPEDATAIRTAWRLVPERLLRRRGSRRGLPPTAP
jgi:uncharacterized protein involved in exopolysaccharide biosynthesis